MTMLRAQLLPFIVVVALSLRSASCSNDFGYSQDDLAIRCNGGLIYSDIGALEVYVSAYQDTLNCTASYQTMGIRKIMARFQNLNMPYSSYCERGRVELFDGRATPENRLTGPHGECGWIVPEVTYFTSGPKLNIHFYGKYMYGGEGFSVILTDYYDEYPCESGDFTCNDGLCIDGYLACDGWANCADYSDENHRTCSFLYNGSPFVITCIAIGGVLALGLILAIVTVSVRRCSRRRREYENLK